MRFLQQPAMLKTFDLEVVAPVGAEPYASFHMRGMEMGMNRYRMLRMGDHWQANVMLPACVQGRRDWMLLLEAGGRIYELPFTAG